VRLPLILDKAGYSAIDIIRGAGRCVAAQRHMNSISVLSRFWQIASEALGRQNSTPTTSSRQIAGQRVGVKQVEEKIWLVSFMRYDLGFFDHETCQVECAPNPFTAKVFAASCAVASRSKTWIRTASRLSGGLGDFRALGVRGADPGCEPPSPSSSTARFRCVRK
jgi:hypothetical protein